MRIQLYILTVKITIVQYIVSIKIVVFSIKSENVFGDIYYPENCIVLHVLFLFLFYLYPIKNVSFIYK